MWSAFNMWLDDFIADHMDRMAALIEQRPDPSIKGALLRATQGD